MYFPKDFSTPHFIAELLQVVGPGGQDLNLPPPSIHQLFPIFTLIFNHFLTLEEFFFFLVEIEFELIPLKGNSIEF